MENLRSNQQQGVDETDHMLVDHHIVLIYVNEGLLPVGGGAGRKPMQQQAVEKTDHALLQHHIVLVYVNEDLTPIGGGAGRKPAHWLTKYRGGQGGEDM